MKNIPVKNDTFKNMGTAVKSSKVRAIPKERLQEFTNKIQKVLDELFQTAVFPSLNQKLTQITTEIRARLQKTVPSNILDALDNKISQVRPKSIQPDQPIAWEEIGKSRELNINPEKLATTYALVQAQLEKTSSEELLRNLQDLLSAMNLLEHLKTYQVTAEEKIKEWDDDDKEQEALDEKLADLKKQNPAAELTKEESRRLQSLTSEKNNMKIRESKRERANIFLSTLHAENFHDKFFGKISPEELETNFVRFGKDKVEYTHENFRNFVDTLTIENLFQRSTNFLPRVREFCEKADIPFGTDFPDTEHIPEIIKRLSDELHETFRIELIKEEVKAAITQVVTQTGQTKEKTPKKKVRASKALTIFIGAVALMAIGGVVALVNAPAPKPKSDDRSYPPYNPTPSPRPRPEPQPNQPPKNQPNNDNTRLLNENERVIESGVPYTVNTFDYDNQSKQYPCKFVVSVIRNRRQFQGNITVLTLEKSQGGSEQGVLKARIITNDRGTIEDGSSMSENAGDQITTLFFYANAGQKLPKKLLNALKDLVKSGAFSVLKDADAENALKRFAENYKPE